MMLSYKDAHINDLPIIVEIYNSTIAGRLVTADTQPVSIDQKMEWFLSHHKWRPIKMISCDKETIGWISFQDFYGRPAYAGTAEISIYLAEKHRQKGYGDIILKNAIRWCTDLKIHTLLAFIFAHNHRSITLFERNGFIEWGLLKNVAKMDNNFYSLIILGLSVNQNSVGSPAE